MSSLHSPLSVRSFRRCGFTIYRTCKNTTHGSRFLVVHMTFGQRKADAFGTHLELSWKHPAGVDVAGVCLDGLIVAQDLGSGSCGHWSQKQTIPHTVPEDAQDWSGSENYSFQIQLMWTVNWQQQRKEFRKTHLAIFSFSAFQSHKSVGVLFHMSYWRIWNTNFFVSLLLSNC